MSNPHDPNDALEQLVDAAVRDLPVRRAPRSLEARVLAEIERRAAQPWWRQSFMHWPVSVRLLFLGICVVTGIALARGAAWLFGGSASALSEVRSELAPATTSVKATAEAFSLLADSIPSLWIYGGLAVMAVMYATLFGIGAAAYRTFYASR